MQPVSQSGDVSIMRGLGIEVEAGRNVFSEEVTFEGRTYSSRSSAFFVGAGPRFVARARRASSFAHVLLGTENRSAYQPSLQFGVGGDLWMSNAWGIGGGIDGRVTRDEDETTGLWRSPPTVAAQLSRFGAPP